MNYDICDVMFVIIIDYHRISALCLLVVFVYNSEKLCIFYIVFIFSLFSVSFNSMLYYLTYYNYVSLNYICLNFFNSVQKEMFTLLRVSGKPLHSFVLIIKRKKSRKCVKNDFRKFLTIKVGSN